MALCGLALALAASGCSTTGSNVTRGANYVEGDGTIKLVDAPDRVAAPELSGSLVGGGSGALSDQAGKVVVLNVWASWCGPCRTEAPDLVTAARRLSDVAFFGINTRDNQANAEAFIRSQEVPYPSFADQDGSLVLEMQRVLPMSALPITIILDKQHRVAAAIYGPTTALTIEAIVRPLERESP